MKLDFPHRVLHTHILFPFLALGMLEEEEEEEGGQEVSECVAASVWGWWVGVGLGEDSKGS